MSPLEELHVAIQSFSNSMAANDAEAGVITQAIVVWEELSFDEDGTTQYQPLYAATGEANPSRSLGLAYYLLKTLDRDIIGGGQD